MFVKHRRNELAEKWPKGTKYDTICFIVRFNTHKRRLSTCYKFLKAPSGVPHSPCRELVITVPSDTHSWSSRAVGHPTQHTSCLLLTLRAQLTGLVHSEDVPGHSFCPTSHYLITLSHYLLAVFALLRTPDLRPIRTGNSGLVCSYMPRSICLNSVCEWILWSSVQG